MVTTTIAEQILEELEQADTLEKLYKVTYLMRDSYRVKHVVYYWVNSIGEIKWFSLGPFIQFHRIHTCLAPKIQRFGCRQFLDV